MKRVLYISLLCFSAACSRLDADRDVNGPVPASDGEMVFSVIEENETPTKVTNVTTLSGANAFYVSFGMGGTTQWNNVQFSETGTGTGKFSAGRLWPDDDSSTYAFVASNVPLTNGGTAFAPTIALSASSLDTDIIYAYNGSATWGAVCPLTFKHVFAELGSVTVNAQDGYTISGVDVKIYDTYSNYGSFNPVTEAFTGTSTVTLYTSATRKPTVSNSTPGTKANSLCFVPGTYTIVASWTATRGAYSQSFSVASTVELTRAKITNLTTTLGGSADEVVFDAVVTDWISYDDTLDFPAS